MTQILRIHTHTHTHTPSVKEFLFAWVDASGYEWEEFSYSSRWPAEKQDVYTSKCTKSQGVQAIGGINTLFRSFVHGPYQELTELAESYKSADGRKGTNHPHSCALSPLWNRRLHLWREGQTGALVKTHCSSGKGARKKMPHPSGERWGQEYVQGPELWLEDNTGAARSFSLSLHVLNT